MLSCTLHIKPAKNIKRERGMPLRPLHYRQCFFAKNLTNFILTDAEPYFIFHIFEFQKISEFWQKRAYFCTWISCKSLFSMTFVLIFVGLCQKNFISHYSEIKYFFLGLCQIFIRNLVAGYREFCLLNLTVSQQISSKKFASPYSNISK